MKRNIILGLSLAASLLGATVASAQVIYVDQRGGDRSRHERDFDRDHDRREYRRSYGERHGWDRGHHRGWDRGPILVRRGYHDRHDDDCRDITIRKHNRWGELVVKHIRKCG